MRKRPNLKLSENAARRLKAAGGVGLIAVGIPLIPLPVPIGWAVTLTGVAVLTKNSDNAREGLDKLVARYPDAPRKYRMARRKLNQINPFTRKAR